MSDERQDEERTPRVVTVKRIHAKLSDTYCEGSADLFDGHRGAVKMWSETGYQVFTIEEACELRTALGLAIAAAEGLAQGERP